MTIKINISRQLPVKYKKIIHEVLQVSDNFTNLDHINHIINPQLTFTEVNQLKKRELIFKYPIPAFLSLICGNSFEIRVMETSVINKHRCSVNCIISISTLIGEIKFLETAIYTNGMTFTDVKIELTSISNNLKIILEQIAEKWRIDHELFLDKLMIK